MHLRSLFEAFLAEYNSAMPIAKGTMIILYTGLDTLNTLKSFNDLANE